MLDNEIALTANKQAQPFSVIKNLITEFNFLNLGTIKAIHNENYIDVQTYYKNGDKTDNVITDVRLLQLGTTKCKVFIQPAIGDNVLILTPKDFVPTLTYNEKPQDFKTSYMPYGNINACAILIRDEGDDNVKTTVNIDANGNISVTTEGDANVSANNIVLNGGEQNSHLVRYEELEAAVNKFMDALNTHTHTGVETGSGTTLAPTTMEFDISKAKVPTVLTEKASS